MDNEFFDGLLSWRLRWGDAYIDLFWWLRK